MKREGWRRQRCMVLEKNDEDELDEKEKKHPLSCRKSENRETSLRL